MSTVGVLIQVLAFDLERTYVLCSTTVPHVPCPMAQFASLFLLGGVLICLGLVVLILAIRSGRPAFDNTTRTRRDETGKF